MPSSVVQALPDLVIRDIFQESLWRRLHGSTLQAIYEIVAAFNDYLSTTPSTSRGTEIGKRHRTQEFHLQQAATRSFETLRLDPDVCEENVDTRRNIRYMNGKLRPGIRRLLTSLQRNRRTRGFRLAPFPRKIRFSHESWKLPRESGAGRFERRSLILEVSMTDEIFGASLRLLNKSRRVGREGCCRGTDVLESRDYRMEPA